MALYQNGILISGANKLPQMTYAAWQALPVAERPSEWICTDRSYSDLPASDVAYDNTDSGLSADNIQDAIDEVAQSSGGGGHTIVNPSGQSMSQENKLQFTDAGVADDSTNGKTKVSIVREMTKAEYDALSEVERKGVIRITDEPDIVMGDVEDDKVEVTADGVKTWQQLLNELYALIDTTKISQNSLLVVDFIAYKIVCVLTYTTSAEYQFSKATISSGNKLVTDKFVIKSSNSTYGQKEENVTISDRTSQQATSGTKLTLYYGTQSAPIELTTDAEHCMMSDGRNVEAVLDGIGTITETVSASLTINANSWGASAISPTIPTGYHIKSISAYSTHLALLGASVAFNSNQYQVYAYNIASGERTGGVYATFVYEKN